MIQTMINGHSPIMRHLGRTHRVDIKWLSERFKEQWVDLLYCDTRFQAADIFIKAFHDKKEMGSCYYADPLRAARYILGFE